MWRIFLFSTLLLGNLAHGAEIDLAKRQNLTPTEAASLKQDVVFLDVRSSIEWYQGHLKGAIHIPHDEVDEKVGSLVPDKSLPVVTYCAVGGRAASVVKSLRSKGYTVVPVTRGGYRELVENGMQHEIFGD
jgi:phage shock protein E